MVVGRRQLQSKGSLRTVDRTTLHYKHLLCTLRRVHRLTLVASTLTVPGPNPTRLCLVDMAPPVRPTLVRATQPADHPS